MLRKKRCSIGRSCRYSCISSSYVCDVELDDDVSESLSTFLKRVKPDQSSGRPPKSSSTPLVRRNTRNPEEETRLALSDAVDFDKTFKVKAIITGSKDNINWSDSLNRGKKIGDGQFGTAMLVKASKGQSGYVVKRGQVGIEEANIIKILGDAGLGPKLIYGEVAEGKPKREYGTYTAKGRIAMSRVPGKDYAEFTTASDKVGNTTIGDAFWLLRSQVHKMGIAHNDGHTGNVLIDGKGKSRFVDMGIAQQSAKAALSEAIGAFTDKQFLPSGARPSYSNIPQGISGDRSAKLDPQMGIFKGKLQEDAPRHLLRIVDNLPKVYQRMRDLGLNDNEIARIITQPTRQPLEEYEQGPWAKISRSNALELINMLYEGVGKG